MLCLLLLAAQALGDEPKENWYVRANLQIVQMPQADALRLVPKLRNERTAAAAGDEIQRQLDAGVFTRVAELSGSVLSGETCETTEGENFNFAAQYRLDEQRVGPSREQISKSKERMRASHLIDRFDSREIGAALRVAPVVFAWGKLIQMKLSASVVQFECWDRTETGVQDNGLIRYTEQPVFRLRRSTGFLSFCPEIPQVAAIHQFSGPAPMTELHLVTAKVRKLPALPPAAAVVVPHGKVVERAVDTMPVVSAAVELHRFHVPQKEALSLRSLFYDNSKIATAFAKLLDSTAQGRAQLIEWQVLQIPSGSDETVRVDNVRERRHGKDHEDPPATLDLVYVGNRVSVEAKPFWGGELCSFGYESNILELPEFHRLPASLGYLGTTSYGFQPLFRSRRMVCEVSLSRDQQILLGFTLLQDTSGEKVRTYEITFVRRVSRE